MTSCAACVHKTTGAGGTEAFNKWDHLAKRLFSLSPLPWTWLSSAVIDGLRTASANHKVLSANEVSRPGWRNKSDPQLEASERAADVSRGGEEPGRKLPILFPVFFPTFQVLVDRQNRKSRALESKAIVMDHSRAYVSFFNPQLFQKPLCG